MPENFGTYIAVGVVVFFNLFVAYRVFYKLYQDRHAPVKTVKAQLCDKYIADNLSKTYGSAARKAQCYVVFAVGEHKLRFAVSDFSYPGYQVGKKGTLRYKGSKLIDFR